MYENWCKGRVLMRKKRRFKKNILIRNIIVLAITCFIIVFFVRQEITIRKYRTEIKNLSVQIEEQQEIRRELEEKEKLYSSNEYIEKIAREVLGMVSADEKVYIDENEAD